MAAPLLGNIGFYSVTGPDKGWVENIWCCHPATQHYRQDPCRLLSAENRRRQKTSMFLRGSILPKRAAASRGEHHFGLEDLPLKDAAEPAPTEFGKYVCEQGPSTRSSKRPAVLSNPQRYDSGREPIEGDQPGGTRFCYRLNRHWFKGKPFAPDARALKTGLLIEPVRSEMPQGRAITYQRASAASHLFPEPESSWTTPTQTKTHHLRVFEGTVDLSARALVLFSTQASNAALWQPPGERDLTTAFATRIA